MAVGYPKTQDSLNAIAGDLAASLNRDFRRAGQFKTELDQISTATLQTFGYSADEATALKNAAADMAQLNTIYIGGLTLLLAKDFRTNLRPLWGALGDM